MFVLVLVVVLFEHEVFDITGLLGWFGCLVCLLFVLFCLCGFELVGVVGLFLLWFMYCAFGVGLFCCVWVWFRWWVCVGVLVLCVVGFVVWLFD